MTSSIGSVKSTALVVYTPQKPLSAQAKAYREKMQNIFVAKSFKAQVADHQYFHRYGMGDIVVLSGTSTAGKTSIIQALRQIEPNRIEDGFDLRANRVFFDFFKKQCPNEIAILEKVIEPFDIPKAVFGKERPWKMTVSDPEKMAVEESIQQVKKMLDSLPKEEMDALFQKIEPSMFDEAFELSRCGRSVIFDAFDIDALARQALMRGFDGPMKVALVYCPFSILSSRMEQRNREAEQNGNLSNQRIGAFPLNQFSQIFTKKEKNQRTLETITRDQAIRAFNANFDQRTLFDRREGNPLPPEAEILREKAKQRQEFLNNLGFEENVDQVQIAPRDPEFYHLLLNSSQLTPEDSAKILHKGH